MNYESRGGRGHEALRYADYLNPQAEKELKEMGIGDLVYAFPVTSEESIGGEVDAKKYWIRFKQPAIEGLEGCADVEGKFYVPNSPNGELILFTPGFPGGNAGRFEMRYAKILTDNGYSFFTVRHNGSNVSKLDTAAEIINSPERLELAKQHNETHIGGFREQGYSPMDIANEPITPFVALQKSFKRIHLMGQSMGVAASYNAVSRLSKYPEYISKISKVVGIAGYVGGEQEKSHDIWDGMKMPVSEMIDYEWGYIAKVGTNCVPSKEVFRQELKKVAQLNENMAIPETIDNVLVFSPGDPLISGPDLSKAGAVYRYGPKSKRKLIIRDNSAPQDPKQHSMLWIRPENILRAVRANVSELGPHYVNIPKNNASLVEPGI